MAEACTADANVFLYSEPWHATADQCMQRGCRLQHVQLQDFLPHAQSGDRNKLRTAVRAGKIFDLDVDTDDAAEAKRIGEEAAAKVLSNDLIEGYEVIVG